MKRGGSGEQQFKAETLRKRKRGFRLAEAAGMALLLLSWLILLLYIWGPSVYVMHSDSTDTILWAKAAAEAGRSFNPDFTYAALLPFGANLWYVPLVMLGGMTVKVQLWGISIFLFLFSGAMYFMFTGLGMRPGGACAATALSLLLFSGSEKLREIFWGHVIYYSLALFFLALALGLIFRYRSGEKKLLWALLLGALSIGAATDGVQMAAVYVLPLGGALVLELLLSKDHKTLAHHWKSSRDLLLLLAAATSAGFALLLFLRRGGIVAGYAEAYSHWSETQHWAENFQKMIPEFLLLFGAEVRGEAIHMVSLRSIGLMLLIAAALLILFVPLAALFRYGKIRDERTQLLLLLHLVNSALILFLYVFGLLASASWRLIPLLGTGLWATIALLREHLSAAEREWGTEGETALPADAGEGADGGRKAADFVPAGERPLFRLAVLAFLFLFMAGGVNFIRLAQLQQKPGGDPQREMNLAYMEKENLRYGFASFWNANIYTLRTDGETRVRDINVNDEGISKRLYQSEESWYKEQPDTDEYFLLLTEPELQTLKASPEWPELQPLIKRSEQVGQHIFLFFDRALIPFLQK